MRGSNREVEVKRGRSRYALSCCLCSVTRRANHSTLSMTGNSRDVALARRLLYQALEGDGDFLDDLILQLQPGWFEREAECAHVWAALCSQRILACPYVPYWDKLARSRDDIDDAASPVWQSQRALWCPNCSDAFAVAI